MPDQSEVESALAKFLAGVLYPEGSDKASLLGPVFRVFPGWPVAAALEADLGQGVVQVSVTVVPGHVRDTTRYSSDLMDLAARPSLLDVTVAGNTVTLSGEVAEGQVAGIKVDGRTYAYRVSAGDDAGSVAAALSVMVRVDRPAVLRGASVQLPGGIGVQARTAADGSGVAELRRQVMAFRVSVWAPGVRWRDEVATALDGALAGLTFLNVSGWACRVKAGVGAVSDQGSAAGVWRRDIGVSVEFPTTALAQVPAMLFGVDRVNGVSLTV